MPFSSLVLRYLNCMDKIGVNTLVFENSSQKCILSAKKKKNGCLGHLQLNFTAREFVEGTTPSTSDIHIKTSVTEHKANKDYPW